MYMAEFKFKFIYKCIIICIDCFVVNKHFVLLKNILFYYNVYFNAYSQFYQELASLFIHKIKLSVLNHFIVDFRNFS